MNESLCHPEAGGSRLRLRGSYSASAVNTVSLCLAVKDSHVGSLLRMTVCVTF